METEKRLEADEESTRLFIENNYPQIVASEGDETQADDRPLARRGISLPVPLSRETSLGHRGDRVVRLNVGGRVFTTWSSTLQKAAAKVKGFKLADDKFLSDKYDAARDEYFLDHDPEVFGCVLNFLRSGQLHLPHGLCGPRLKEELTYWGVSPTHIQPCCWQTFQLLDVGHRVLKRLEMDSKFCSGKKREEGEGEEGGEGEGGGAGGKSERPSRCKNGRELVWDTLTDPSCSKAAKVYGWVALIFVTLAIFSFCAATHMAFRVPIHTNTTSSQNVSSTNDTAVNTTSSPPQQTPAPARKKTIEEQLSETDVHPSLFLLDLVCLVFFTIEFFTKLICAPSRLRYLRSINGIVDILALSPDFVEMIVMAADPNNLQGESSFLMFLPFLRLMRVFRVFRLVRHVQGLWVMIYTLRASFSELFLMLVFLFVGTLLFSSAIFFLDDKEVFSSIPHGFWWAIVTMTTVGYGDMYPVTPLGYLLGSMTAVSGVLMIGFTVPALVNNFGINYGHVQYVFQRKKLLKKEAEREKEEKGEKGAEGSMKGAEWNDRDESNHEHIPLREVKNQ